MAHSSSSLAMLLLATPLAAAPLVTVEALAVFVAGVDVTGGGRGGAAAVAGIGGDIGGDGGTTAAGVAVVVVTLAAAAMAEGDRHGDAATGGTTDAAAGVTAATADGTTGVDGTDGTGGDAFIVAVDADDGGVEIDVVAEDVDDVAAAGGIAGTDGVVAIGAVAFATETGSGDDVVDNDDDFAAAAEGSLLPAIPPVARPPLNGITGGANLRRGVSSDDGRVIVPPVEDTTPSTSAPPSPFFSVSCARWSSSTCRKRSSGTDSGRGPVSV